MAHIEQALDFVKIAERQYQYVSSSSFQEIEGTLNEAIAQAQSQHLERAIKTAEKAQRDLGFLIETADRPGGCPEGRPC